MLYLTRRWAGAIWLAMPVHGSQDFLITSGQIGADPETSPLSFLVLPVMIGDRHPAVAPPASDRAGAADARMTRLLRRQDQW
jgi:hypothetical protein